MCTHTWEEPETYQIQTQAKQDDWSKEIWKKCKIQTTTNAQLSLSESTHMSIHMYYMYVYVYLSIYLYIYISPFILDTLPVHYFLSLWEFFSVKLKSQAPLLTTGVVPKIQRSYHQNPTLISGQESKPCFKLLHTKPT